jgi:hypothetical protein
MTINPRERLRVDVLGVWTLVTLQSIGADGVAFYPLGPDLAGQLVYDVSGRMSAQIVRTDHPRFASDDNTQALPDEMAAAWRGYIGYFGTFTIDPEAGVVTHHVEGAWFPNLDGTDVVRTCRLDGDRLVLEAHTDFGQTVIIWKRVPSSGAAAGYASSVSSA